MRVSAPGADMPQPDGPRQPGRSRSELERLLDRTVLGPTHPELGTCWSFTGMTTPYGRIAKARTVTPTDLAGSSFAVQFPRARSYTTGAESTPAGILITWSSSPMRRINGTCARRTVSMGIRCPARTSGSGQTGSEPAGRVTQRTSGRSGNASTPARTGAESRPLSRSPIGSVMLTSSTSALVGALDWGSAQKPAAERPGPLDERFVDGGRGHEGVDHVPPQREHPARLTARRTGGRP